VNGVNTGVLRGHRRPAGLFLNTTSAAPCRQSIGAAAAV